MPRAGGLDRVAWSGAALGGMLIVVGGIWTPAPGSNYADVLAAQAGRIEAGMGVGARVGIGLPAAVWLLQAVCQRFGRTRGEPSERAEPDVAPDPRRPPGPGES